MCPAGCLAGTKVLWVAALVPKSENDARIWYNPIHLNPTGLPVGAVRPARKIPAALTATPVNVIQSP